MTLYYEAGFDTALIGTFSISVSDDDGSRAPNIPTGTYCHTDISSVMGSGEYTDFATAVEDALNDGATGTPYSVTYTASSAIYQITYTGSSSTLTMNGTSGTRTRLALGMTSPTNAAATATSINRPYYHIKPAIGGRSDYSDEYEPDGIAKDSTADDGTAYQIAVDNSSIWEDWTQPGDRDSPGTAYTRSGSGTYVHSRAATTLVPWSYQHFWEHLRTGHLPFYVFDDGITNGSGVYKLRADGASFHPTRWAGTDFDLWAFNFRTRLIGRLSS